jgi:hypothetical protein
MEDFPYYLTIIRYLCKGATAMPSLKGRDHEGRSNTAVRAPVTVSPLGGARAGDPNKLWAGASPALGETSKFTCCPTSRLEQPKLRP